MSKKYSKEQWLKKICNRLDIKENSVWYKEFEQIIGYLDLGSISKYVRLFKTFKQGIPDNLFNRFKVYIKLPGKVTKEKSILKYGEVEGLIRWNSYCEKQSVTNSFEYKNKKFGMSREDFDRYNKSRAITKEKSILKYGEVEGLIRWNSYCEKQSVNGCKLEYFEEKYGETDGIIKYKELNKKKSLNLNNFKRKYGEVEGISKFEDYIKKSSVGFVSKISQEFFNLLYEKIQFVRVDKDKIYFDSKNFEFGSMTSSGTFFKYDFVDTKNKIVIEFHGDFWHGNPKIYKPNHIIKKGSFCMKVEDIWKRDIEKNNHMKNLDYKVFVVWESDFINNKEEIIRKVIDAAYGSE